MTLRRLSLAAGTAVAALALAACGSSSSSGSGSSPSTSVVTSASTVASSTAPSTAPSVSTSVSSAPSSAPKGKIVIGAANFGENEIIANLYALALQKAGFTTQVKTVGAREIAEPALEKGSAGGGVDVLPEYLATDTEYFNQQKNGKNATAVASGDVAKTLAAGQPLANGYGVTFLTPSAAQDTNAFAVTAKFAKANNLTTLSDLANYKGKLILGGPAECPTRPYCEPGLEHTYGLKFSGFKALDSGGPLTKQAIAQGKVTIGLVFSSDGGIASNGLQVLLDDKHLQNADNIIAAVNTKLASDAALTAALNSVDAVLTTTDLVALNKSVDVDRKDPVAVAKAYAASKGIG